MATGCAVVCTDAHGNRDFSVDGENCLIPELDRDAVCDALGRVLQDAELRERLGRAGEETAKGFAWEQRIDALEAFLEQVARPRHVNLDRVALPEAQRSVG
jgi:glycosyltransferase involved in cell wall biosynthesis